MKNQSRVIVIERVEIDVDQVISQIDKAKELENNSELFTTLASLSATKKMIDEAYDKYVEVEQNIKQAINDKAKSVYGVKWEAIAGEGYKITRSLTGSVYELTDRVQSKFVVVKKTPNTKEINAYIKAKSKLPAGVEYNPNRGESLRITVK